MKNIILLICSLLFLTCDLFSQSLLIKSFVAKKANKKELVLKFTLVNNSFKDIYLFANNIYYSSTTNTGYIENGYPSDKFMFICLNWTKNRSGSNPTMLDANHSPRLEYFPKCIKIKSQSKALLEIVYKNDSNIEKMNPNKKYLIQSRLSYATSNNWRNMIRAFGTEINKKAIIEKKKIKP